MNKCSNNTIIPVRWRYVDLNIITVFPSYLNDDCYVKSCKLEGDKTDSTERQYLFTDSREYKNYRLGNM